MRVASTIDSLFPDAMPPLPRQELLPPGFLLWPEFLSRDEERALLDALAEIPLRNSKFHEYTARRLTAAFGLRYSFDTGRVSTAPPAPPYLDALAARVARHVGLAPQAFPHVLVTQYPPGAPIGWHRDAPPFLAIYGVSLGASCSFRLRPYQLELRDRQHTVRLELPPRSLYAMTGPARNAWQHSIAPVRDTRWSITLRTLR